MMFLNWPCIGGGHGIIVNHSVAVLSCPMSHTDIA